MIFFGRRPRRSNRNREKSAHVAIIGTRGYPSFYGGFETAVRYLAPHLAQHGWDVTVYGRPGQTNDTAVKPDHRVRRITTRGVDSNLLSTLTYGLSSVLHAAFRGRPNVALVMNVANGYWLPILKWTRVRTVVNVDGIEWHRAKWSRLGKLVFKGGAYFTARYADHLVFDSKAIGQYWQSVLSRDGTFIPYGGTPTQSRDVPLPTARPFVLMVARFVPENTVREFIAAIPTLTPEIDVVMVGNAPVGSELHQRAAAAAELPHVYWLGHVSDDTLLDELWRRCAVYFHGHTVGGTNPALVQAMAQGANVVAVDTVYNREVLAEAGLFTSPDPEHITATVLTARDEPGTRRTLAKRRAVSDYSWPTVCAAYDNLLRSTTDSAIKHPVDFPEFQQELPQ